MAVRKAKSAAKAVSKAGRKAVSKPVKKAVSKLGTTAKTLGLASTRKGSPPVSRHRQFAELCVELFTGLVEWSGDLGAFHIYEETDPTTYPLFLRVHRHVMLAKLFPAEAEDHYSETKALVDGVIPNFDLSLAEFEALKPLLLETAIAPIAPYWFEYHGVRVMPIW